MARRDALCRLRPIHGPARDALASSGRSTALAIATCGLTKHYRNPWTLQVTRGVEDLDLEVRRGEVMGFLGPNGAGKTTTLKLLTGLLKPTPGEAWLLGEPVERARAGGSSASCPSSPTSTTT